MSTLRITRTILKSREHAAQIVTETVAAQIERERLVARRDAKIAAITAEHAAGIEAQDSLIETNMTLLEQWADAEQATWGDARSITLEGHRLGFRLGQPAVKPAKKLTFKAIIAAIAKAGGDLAKKYLRIKTDLDKEAVLTTGRLCESADAAARAAAEQELQTIGCVIEQAETFYLDPAREGQADTTLTTKAA